MKDLEVLYHDLQKYIDAKQLAFDDYKRKALILNSEVESELIKYDAALNTQLLAYYKSNTSGSLEYLKEEIARQLSKQYLEKLIKGDK